MVVKIPPDMSTGLKIALTLLITFLVVGCSEQIDPNQPVGFIQIKGSDTIVNAAQKVAEEFMKEYPHIFVAVTGGGSGVGIASLINKTCDVATASREMKAKEIELANKRDVYPKEFVVAYDGVAVIVNNDNPINKLTIEDLHNIYTGRVTNWKALGGKDLPIVTLSREVSSGTHMYFKEEVVQLGQKENREEFSTGTLLLTSSQAIVEEVVNNESAIGYLGMGYVSDRIKPLMIGKHDDFYLPDVENVLKKAYPLSRPLYFYTNGEPEGVTKLLIDFALGPMGQLQFKETGFVPIRLGEGAIVTKEGTETPSRSRIGAVIVQKN
jgi:phosphate transport system substrate-binding protein